MRLLGRLRLKLWPSLLPFRSHSFQPPQQSNPPIHLRTPLPGHEAFFQDPEGNLLLPHLAGCLLATHLHHLTHLGPEKLREVLRKGQIRFRGMSTFLKDLTSKCSSCQAMRPANPAPSPGTRVRGSRPCEHWEHDFTEIRPGKFGFQYLLVMVDTFTGWPEAFPSKTETTRIVAKHFLEDIIPRCGLPKSIGSDNGPAFAGQAICLLAEGLGVTRKLHCEYRPQSSGQVERMNRTLKEFISKLILETGQDWVTLLPLALFKARNTPGPLSLTPYEVLYGSLPSILPVVPAPDRVPPHLRDFVLSLSQVHADLWPRLQARFEPAPTNLHPFCPGDWVRVNRHRKTTLQPRWKGPFVVLLVTPLALNVNGVGPWVHYSHVWRAHTPSPSRQWQAIPGSPLKIKLRRDQPSPSPPPSSS